MRNPFALYSELGPASFVIVQVLFGGMVISALVHPIFVLTVLWVSADLAMGKALSTFQSTLLIVDSVNIACGYVSFWLLGWRSTPRDRRRGTWRVVPCTLFYWMMMSYAAWRSVIHLYRNPHLWEKTPHGPAAAAANRPPAPSDPNMMPVAA